MNGTRPHSSELPQGGLEVSCILIFQASKEKECEKAKKLIELALSVKIKAIVLEDFTLSEGNASPQYPENCVTVDGSEMCITMHASDIKPAQKTKVE